MTLNKKNILFDRIKRWGPGQKVSSKTMLDYVQAVNNYRNWVFTVFIDAHIRQFEYWVLDEIQIESLPNSKINVNAENIEDKKEKYKEMLIKSNWYPPLIFDNLNHRLLDGHHRLLVLKELGLKKVFVFKPGRKIKTKNN